VSNDTPPRACIADFGFTATTLDQKLPRGAQVEGGTMQFMSPELLVPEEFGMGRIRPTQQADVYAFGLVISQVCARDRGYRPFLYAIFPGPHG